MMVSFATWAAAFLFLAALSNNVAYVSAETSTSSIPSETHRNVHENVAEQLVSLRRRLSDEKSSAATKEAEKVKTEADKKATSDKKKAAKKPKKPKKPVFELHKKKISSDAVNKVANSVAAAKAAAAKEKMSDSKEVKTAKSVESKAAVVEKGGLEKKEMAGADALKVKEADKLAAKKKEDDKRKAEEAAAKKKAEAAKAAAALKKSEAEKEAAKKKEAEVAKAKAATTAATSTAEERKAKEATSNTEKKNADEEAKKKEEEAKEKLEKETAALVASDAKKGDEKDKVVSAKPKAKDVDKYKEELKASREKLLKKNPALEKKSAVGGDNNKAEGASGKNQLDEMTKELQKKQALIKARDVLRKGGKQTPRDGDGSKAHQSRARPLRPGERVFKKLPILKRAYRKTTLQEAYSDATLSFVRGLEHGVFLNDEDPLDHGRKEALKDWLHLLSVTLPPELKIHALIDNLLTNIDMVSEKRSRFMKMMKKHPIKEKKWSKGCSTRGIRESTGGFSCGFWKLLHIVSIGLAEHQGGIDLASNADAISPMKAAEILREYMAMFFGCDICKRNFLAQFDECKYGRCTRLAESVFSDLTYLSDEQWMEFALYLWEVHNGVSVGIFHDQVARAGEQGNSRLSEVSVIWPHIDECFQCLNDDGTFNEENVRRYLVETYWTGPGVDPKETALRQYERSRKALSISNNVLYMSLALMLISTLLMKKRYIKESGYAHKKDDDSGSPKKWRRI